MSAAGKRHGPEPKPAPTSRTDKGRFTRLPYRSLPLVRARIAASLAFPNPRMDRNGRDRTSMRRRGLGASRAWPTGSSLPRRVRLGSTRAKGRMALSGGGLIPQQPDRNPTMLTAARPPARQNRFYRHRFAPRRDLSGMPRSSSPRATVGQRARQGRQSWRSN